MQRKSVLETKIAIAGTVWQTPLDKAVNNAEFLGKVVTSGDMITVLSLVMKAYKAIG
jgi:hypothetical protein